MSKPQLSSFFARTALRSATIVPCATYEERLKKDSILSHPSAPVQGNGLGGDGQNPFAKEPPKQCQQLWQSQYSAAAHRKVARSATAMTGDIKGARP
jgi:hypothetical protein